MDIFHRLYKHKSHNYCWLYLIKFTVFRKKKANSCPYLDCGYIRPVIMHYFIYHLLDYENTDMNLIHSKTYNPALAFVPVYFGLFGHQIWLFHFWTANHKFEGLWIIITLRRNVFGQCRNASFLFSFFSWWITECFCQTWRKWTLEHSSDYTTSVSKIKYTARPLLWKINCCSSQ